MLELLKLKLKRKMMTVPVKSAMAIAFHSSSCGNNNMEIQPAPIATKYASNTNSLSIEKENFPLSFFDIFHAMCLICKTIKYLLARNSRALRMRSKILVYSGRCLVAKSILRLNRFVKKH
jgi:hypothetical protein